MEIINVSPATIQDIKQLLKDQQIKSPHLRVTSRRGWGGTSFYLVQDEPAENDKVEEHDGIQFAIKNNLVDKYAPFSISSFREESRIFLQVNSVSGGYTC